MKTQSIYRAPNEVSSFDTKIQSHHDMFPQAHQFIKADFLLLQGLSFQVCVCVFWKQDFRQADTKGQEGIITISGHEKQAARGKKNRDAFSLNECKEHMLIF